MPIYDFLYEFQIGFRGCALLVSFYAFQVFQILLLNNPFKIIAKRLEEEQAEKNAAKIRRA